MKRLEGRSAIVTGGAGGIGYAIAGLLAEEGAFTLITDINEKGARDSADRISAASGIKVLGIGADVSKTGDCERAVRAAVENFKKVDILVNNAGITKDNLAMRMSDEEWDSVISVNLKGAFLMSRAAMRPMLKQRSGRIVNITSVAGQAGNAGQSNYSASKSGLIGLTKSLARELASRNILVNAVAPGFVKTTMTEKLRDDVKEKLLNAIPLARFAETIDIARAVLFLVSDDSSYITGQTLAVNGGIYI